MKDNLSETSGGRARWPAVMVDLETLSTRAEATIVEIGAVAFDPVTGEVAAEGLEVGVSALSQRRHVCGRTLEWWQEQRKKGLRVPLDGQESLCVGLARLGDYLTRLTREGVTVWAWGAAFDLAILEDAARDYTPAGALPWKYWQGRCARTVCEVAGIRREGVVTHSSLADARQAAEAVCRAWRVLQPEPDFEAGWMRYRRELAETHGGAGLLPTWNVCPEEVRDCFAAGVLTAMGGGAR
jgi:hypothetical protein